MQLLTDERWRDLLAVRGDDPPRALRMLRERKRRPLITDGRLFIVASDHSARGILGIPSDRYAIADRRRTLDALLVSLAHPGVDGVLASADTLEDLALLGALDDKLAFGTMNRGGLAGASWELDDRMTAYDAASIAANGLDGGKLLLRIADDDPATASVLEASARAVNECAALGLPIMVEPLPFHRDATGAAKGLDDDDALLRAVGVGAALGNTSSCTWLKVPAAKDPARMLSTTTLPALILGGTPGADPEATYRSWEKAMEVPNVRGLVVGRSLLYPADGDVAGAIDRAARIVRPQGVRS